MKRKIYNELLKWKTEWNGKTAVLIDGARNATRRRQRIVFFLKPFAHVCRSHGDRFSRQEAFHHGTAQHLAHWGEIDIEIHPDIVGKVHQEIRTVSCHAFRAAHCRPDGEGRHHIPAVVYGGLFVRFCETSTNLSRFAFLYLVLTWGTMILRTREMVVLEVGKL